MRRKLLPLFCGLVFSAAQAQKDMPVLWTNKLDHKIEFTGTGTEARGYSYAATDKEISVFDNKTGTVKWSGRWKDLTPKLRKIDELIPFWESDALFLFDRKMGKDQIAVLEMGSGKLLWSSDVYQDLTDESIVYVPEEDAFAITLKDRLVWVKAKTGEELWSTSKFKGTVGKYVVTGDKQLVMVNFIPEGLMALLSGYKNQIVRIDLKTGNIIWENTYIGRAERKVISKQFLYDLELADDKVYLRMNGIQVYDLKTGANLYSAAFDHTPDGKIVGRPAGAKTFGVYHAVADPVTVGDHLYVLDMAHVKKQYVKKYDRHSGKLIWTSPEIQGGARAIPNMFVVGDKVVLQIGGNVEAQAYIYRREPDGQGGYRIVQEWRIWQPNVKPCGIQVFSTDDGSFVWESERFKKGITNALIVDDQLVVCSGKELYGLDLATGAERYTVPVNKGGVGLAQQIMEHKGKVIVVGDKGISSFDMATGEPVASGKYKKSEVDGRNGDRLILKTEKADIACFDLDDCSFQQYDARKDATNSLSTCGNFVYVYEKKNVTKLATR